MLDGLIISILSLTKHAQEPLRIFILTGALQNRHRQFHALTDEHAALLDRVAKRKNPAHSVVKIDMTALFNANPPTANVNTLFTPYSMLRLYSDLIPEFSDRILYLDADVVCRQPFEDFYHQSLADTEFVGVLDHYGRWFFHHEWQLFDYVNSGVLLLNLKAIRSGGLFERCRDYCRRRPMIMPDQSAVNKLAHHKRLAPERYNEQQDVQADTVFQHFSTRWSFWPIIHTVSVKPWDVADMHAKLHLHIYDDILAEYQTIIDELDAHSTVATNSPTVSKLNQ
ncbi:glycosyltransferase, family 8 [Lentilactobacillus parafarraginis DSM 18390 = JCM 14109]|jgi:lipopolysaccharide biosynthesis glycosyltransferase|uniref:Glycosyltransferase, family 8 n=2 Tax=Lentilactobacillus parafarraginis TaxID=390842 RepID=A0A0R1YSN2_9LACO|nr:glycosyltransferase, family 8 [Lentilactobacillus parafarraginis DSM 18390 = JCM 14109]